MNPLLERKLQELEQAADYECWYLVKQPTAFDSLCYLVSFLKEYKEQSSPGNLHSFIKQRVKELREQKPQVTMSDNYRALRVAAFFGLITMISGRYEEAEITDIYEEICRRCGGAFEKTENYTEIIRRQIEKMYISSEIDEEYEGVRSGFRLYPVMFLYKILSELGRTEGEYAITMTEYRYLVATTRRYEDFADTLLLIKLLREESAANQEFEKYRQKFDSRLIQALKQLPTLKIDRDKITLVDSAREEVAEKIFWFEQSCGIAEDDFSERLNFHTGFQSPFSRNRIIFGAPGTGKSYTLNLEKEELLGTESSDYERVTFHPNYSYANFVGTYKPVSGKDEEGKDTIRYEYVPGPFMRVYANALESGRNPESVKPFLLVIEEINRANVAAVFGEVFQLLDRDSENVSEYSIEATEDMKKYLAERLQCAGEEVTEIRIPDNMFIWATMNSADQGVFPVDTAFKRRWDFEYIGVDDGQAAVADYLIPIGGRANRKYVKWDELRTRINAILTSDECRVNEDKLLGPFFLSKNVLEHALDDEERFVKAFESKVLMYLFEDAVKMRPANIFKGHRGRMIFSEICKTFEKTGEGVFGITDLEEYEKMAEE